MSSDRALRDRLIQLWGEDEREFVECLVAEFDGLRNETARLKRELAAVAAYPAASERWLAVGPAPPDDSPLPNAVVVDPDQLLKACDGFYPVEYTREGVPFRWTGPSLAFSFDVFVDRSTGADLQFEALSSIDFPRQKNLLLFVDGISVPMTVTPKGDGFVVSSTLPMRTQSAVTSLVFVLPAVFSPAESTDTRLLGVAFGRLRVSSSETTAADSLASNENPVLAQIRGLARSLHHADVQDTPHNARG